MTPEAWKRLRTAAIRSTLRPPERLILLVAGEVKDLNPERLAEGAGVSVDLVLASIEKLLAVGVLERVGADLRVVDAWTRQRLQIAVLPPSSRQAQDRRIAAAWYARWATRHPRAVKTIPDECERLALAACDLLRREHGSDLAAIEREGCDLVDWIATSPDAAFWQREGRTSFQTAFRHTNLSDRLARARAWADAGRPQAEEPVARRADPGMVDAAERSWTFVDRWIRAGESGIPAAAAEKMGSTKVARLEAAIAAVGSWREIGRLTPRDEPSAKRAFVAAFVEYDGKVSAESCARRANR